MKEKTLRYPVFTPQNSFSFYYYDFATLSSDVYFESPNQTELAEGWVTFCDSKQLEETDAGYFGRCYTRKTTKDNKDYLEIAFAHRGTIVDFGRVDATVDNLISDFRLGFATVPAQVKPAVNFSKKALAQIADHFHNIAIYYPSHCGHSLGAIISDCASQILFKSELASGLTVTFDNPGSLNVLKKLIEEKEISEDAIFQLNIGNAFILQGDYNFINTALPKVRQPEMLYTDYTEYPKRRFDDFFIKYPNVSYSIYPTYLINDFYVHDFTFFIHQIDLMCDYLKKNSPHLKLNFVMRSKAELLTTNAPPDWNLNVSYPENWTDGYKKFATYYLREEFWKAYYSLYWLQHPEIHKDFENEESKFYADRCKELEKIAKGVACDVTKQEDSDHPSIIKVSIFNSSLGKNEQHDFVLVQNKNDKEKKLNTILQEDYNKKCLMM